MTEAIKKSLIKTLKPIDLLARVKSLYTPTNLVFPTGFKEFDRAMDGGVREGELITISGPTGAGKTSFALNLSYNFSKKSVPSLWFSYEMNPYYLSQNFQKLIGKESLYDLLVYTPVELIERSLAFIEQQIRTGIEENAIKIIFIDHLHFLVNLRNLSHPSLFIGAVVRDLKQMAIRNKVAIFLIAHTKKIYLGEEIDLSSIRDSALVACESDYVFLVERKKEKGKVLKNGMGTEWTNQTRIKLAKNRRTGKLFFIDFDFVNNKLVPIKENGQNSENFNRIQKFPNTRR
ncbi:AAA family ATPase [bacterium]|nr:AAA family ATPase [bacterium]